MTDQPDPARVARSVRPRLWGWIIAFGLGSIGTFCFTVRPAQPSACSRSRSPPGLLWQRMSSLPRWRPLKRVLLTARIVCLICFALLGVASATDTAQGLAERLLVTSVTIWIGITASFLTRTNQATAT